MRAHCQPCCHFSRMSVTKSLCQERKFELGKRNSDPEAILKWELGEQFEQCLGLYQVRGIESFGKPLVNRSQQLIALPAFILLLPKAAQAHSGSQFQRFCLLLAGDGK